MAVNDHVTEEVHELGRGRTTLGIELRMEVQAAVVRRVVDARGQDEEHHERDQRDHERQQNRPHQAPS
jgi:hypothetical protein